MILKRFGLYLALFLIALMVLGPFYALKEALSLGKLPAAVSRQHYNTGNTTRLDAGNWDEMQKLVLDIRYGGSRPSAVVVADASSWPVVLACQSLSASPPGFPVIMFDPAILAVDELLRKVKDWAPAGSDKINGAGVLLAGPGAVALNDSFMRQGFKTYTVAGKDAAENVAALASVMINTSKSRKVLLVGDGSVNHALPAATWLAHRGTPLLLAQRNDIPDASRRILERAGGNLDIYVLGPESQVSQKVLHELAKWGRVKRIGQENFFANAVAFARFYDSDHRFGWEANQATAEAARHFLLGSSNTDWRTMLAAAQLFSGPNFGPLLLTEPDHLPAATEKLLWSTAPDWWVTPAEGPFNHTWIAGGLDEVSYAVQARADFIQEIRAYLDQGAQGISGSEALAIVWFALSLAAALWVWFHLSTRLTQLAPFMKISWVLVMLVLGPVGLWAYYTCYRGYGHQTVLGEFPRPLWVQVLSATLSTIGFSIPTMLATAFLIAFFGMPLFVIPGFFFWLGSPMTQSIIWSYLAALLVNMFIFVPLMLRAKERSSYRDTVRDNALTVFISMTSISIGMMAAMWLLQMKGLPVMPKEEHILWWGTAWAANIIGLFTGYIGNWSLVVRGRKIGTM